MNHLFMLSKERDYSVYDPKQNFGLSEHFYGEEADEKFLTTIEKVHANLDALI